MGHHVFINGKTALRMNDANLYVVRHFLIVGASALKLAEPKAELEQWDWQGPGVWINTEVEVLRQHPAVFDAAIQAVQSLGDKVDVAYLKTHVRKRGVQFLVDKDVRKIVDDITALREHVLQVPISPTAAAQRSSGLWARLRHYFRDTRKR